MGKTGLIEFAKQGEQVAGFTGAVLEEVGDGLLAEGQPTPLGPLAQQLRAAHLVKGLEPVGGAPGQARDQVRELDPHFSGRPPGGDQQASLGLAEPIVEVEEGLFPGRNTCYGIQGVEGDAVQAFQFVQDGGV
jgi:hypothetical protein